ncbi:MAG: M48 family metallopeptidase, partial [Planctomycetes bacterium]|nr:M48 family metallopeptidase [Planctomycetota bacterium]
MATDFFSRQDRARRNTSLLVLYFALAVVLIVLGVYLVFAGVFLFAGGQGKRYDQAQAASWWSPQLFLATSAGTLTVIVAGSLYKTVQLRRGGDAVAQILGGRRIDPETGDFHERRLVNVVEEMAIASGTPVPPVYVLDQEASINAFAAGYTPGDAVVGVTRGTLERLSRDELQGVIAHEFSHILNGDMRLNVRLIGILHGILVLAIIGYMLLRSTAYRGGKRGAAGALLVGLGLVILGYAGVFVGKLIKSAVSRQREFLADASAVQFTRNPAGIAGALRKIGGMSHGARIENPHAEEASHMFFGNAVGAWLSLTSTHPPLEERIRRIDPAFDGTFTPSQPAPEPSQAQRRAAGKPSAAPLPFPVRLPSGSRLPLDPAQVVALVGAPAPAHLAYAGRLVESLPERLRSAAHSPFSARAVIFALLLDRDQSIRQAQLEQLAGHAEAPVVEETRRLAPLTDDLPREARVPLVDMAFPALRALSDSQYRAFQQNVDRLVRADRKIQLFEYVLQRMLMRHLDEHFAARKRSIVQHHALRPLLPHCAALLSSLAHVG